MTDVDTTSFSPWPIDGAKAITSQAYPAASIISMIAATTAARLVMASLLIVQLACMAVMIVNTGLRRDRDKSKAFIFIGLPAMALGTLGMDPAIEYFTVFGS